MFQSSFVDGARSGRRPLSFTASFIFQCGLVAVAMVIPLLNTAELPAASWVSQILAPAPPPAAPPPAAPAVAPRRAPVRQYDGVPRQPQAIPDKAARIEDAETAEWAPPSVGVPSGVPCPGCMRTGVIGSISSSTVVVPPPPPVLKEPKAVVPGTPIQVVSELQAAKLIHKVTPAYPSMAKAVRVSGVVQIEAIIARDGTMRSLQVLRGHPLLINAAVEAVKQWRYRPTLLQGQPVEVITRIEVNFTLR